MNHDQKRIILEQILASGQRRPDGSPISATSRWGFYLMLIPVVALMAVLGMFFFAAFVALFALIAAGLGIRFWWLKRKMQQANPTTYTATATSPQTQQPREAVDIEDAQIIDEKMEETKSYKKY